ncbi:MAG TPA: D-alanyl-D-alanine carboxypeptidase/D-alanyl-D-alanine-endopeptidase [Steroidobacteraceae bacterium]|nr:D-alanyl-D-alanine carboxypeptidase/D-alanyl-D-alanine-endopeptidase [Steroidobacteraceae bacterium]
MTCGERGSRAPRAAGTLVLALLASLSRPAHADWEQLADLEHRGARVTAAAVDLAENRVLSGLNAGSRLTPASLTKLTLAAAALETWPADKAFKTQLQSAAKIEKGELQGDLVLQGAGDPSLDDHALWSLAAQLRGSGVTAVRGRLIVNSSPFGLVACETEDRCKALERSDTAYNAPLSAIGVDFGNWCISVRPATPGAPAAVRGCGVATLPMSIEGTIETVSASARQTFWVERVTRNGADVLRVGGNIPVDRGQELYRSMSNPAQGVGLLFRQTLREIGIRMDGAVEVTASTLPEKLEILAEYEGLTLREQLGRMLRFSNNYIADVLTLNLAAERAGQPPARLSSAGTVLADFVSRAQRSVRFAALETAPSILSGSGLTPENLLSANDLVALLAYQYRDSRHFPAFYGGLTVPRDAPFQFLRNGSPEWLDRVALKTGTMELPHSVCGVAGYMRKRDNGWLAFAVIVNGGPQMVHVPIASAMTAIRTDLEEILAKY